MAILLLDDNEMDVFINRKLIETSGINHDVLTFTRPHEALSHLEGEHDVKVIIVDNQMPELSGYDVLKTVIDKGEKEPHMIVLSASVHPLDEKKYQALNPSIKLWEKPLNTEHLKSLLNDPS
ncbi:MAG: response regulator [Bacteroidetes bacterium]|nr:response regulator [Bacteroidota bacterium]